MVRLRVEIAEQDRGAAPVDMLEQRPDLGEAVVRLALDVMQMSRDHLDLSIAQVDRGHDVGPVEAQVIIVWHGPVGDVDDRVAAEDCVAPVGVGGGSPGCVHAQALSEPTEGVDGTVDDPTARHFL